MLLTDLDDDLLLLVFGQLDTCSLAGLACTCHRLNALVASDELWEPLCRARWRHLHTAFYERRTVACSRAGSPTAQRSFAPGSSAGCPDWKALYYAGNGWHTPSFDLRHIPLDADCDFVSAIARAGQGELLTIATSHRIEQWDPGRAWSQAVSQIFRHAVIHALTTCAAEGIHPLPPAGCATAEARKVAAVALHDHDLIYSLTLALGSGQVLAGCRDGALSVFDLTAASEDSVGPVHTARRPNVW